MNLVENILTNLFNEDGQLNVEAAEEFVTGNYETEEELENSVFSVLSQLQLPSEFVANNLEKFNKFELILHGNIDDFIVASNTSYFSELIIKNAFNSDNSGFAEQCVDILFEGDRITPVFQALLALDALKKVREVLNNILKKSDEPDFEEVYERVNKVYDIIFLTFAPNITAPIEAGQIEESHIKEALLPWSYVYLKSLVSLPIPEDIKPELVEGDFLRAIGYLDDMAMIKNAMRTYEEQ